MNIFITIVIASLLAMIGWLVTYINTHIKSSQDINLSEDDLDFLIELQHEMNTQDHVGQASPRFWVVAGTQRVFRGNEYATDGEVLLHDSEEVADGLDEAVEYFKDNYAEELEEQNILIQVSPVQAFHAYDVIQILPDINESTVEDYSPGDEIIFEKSCIVNIEELLEGLEDVGLLEDNGLYDSASYSNEHYRYPDTLFITNRSCKEHIKANYYHYSKDAHSYAMTAWRSPEVEKLWNILENTNWEALKKCSSQPEEVKEDE